MTHTFLLTGDCVEALRTFPDNSIDAVVTDPPYGLSRHPDAAEVLRHWLAGDDYQHRGGGFMGKTWDSFVPGPEVWREVFRVLKPGGHLLASFGTRTYDLGCMAIRLAGFQIRDQLDWLNAQGMPKSHNVAREIDRRAGIAKNRGKGFVVAGYDKPYEGQAGAHRAYVSPEDAPGAPWNGWGTALAPGHEPIVLARKPLVGTVAANVLEHGTGGLHIDACRIMPPGTQPKNVLLDEHAAELLDEQTGDSGDPSRFFYIAKASRREREAGLEAFATQSAGELAGGRQEGSAGLLNPRAGAGHTSKGRANTHPTIKPLALMRWLVRLITPPGGTVLDPFAGSGSTGCAAVLEGFHFVGCELSEEYVRIAEARIAHWRGVGEAA